MPRVMASHTRDTTRQPAQKPMHQAVAGQFETAIAAAVMERARRIGQAFEMGGSPMPWHDSVTTTRRATARAPMEYGSLKVASEAAAQQVTIEFILRALQAVVGRIETSQRPEVKALLRLSASQFRGDHLTIWSGLKSHLVLNDDEMRVANAAFREQIGRLVEQFLAAVGED